MWRVCVFVLALTACAAPPSVERFRDTDVTLAGSTRFEPQAFAGKWVVRAQFDGAVQPKTVSFSYDGAQTRMQTQSQTKSLQWQGPLERFGRMRLKSGAQEMDVVVLWVDEGFRTASIGTPDGSFGWIIDRAARGGADRIKAAGEILAFNGYDVTRLNVTP
jgi:apolipoprotein D and lipocalin family protein